MDFENWLEEYWVLGREVPSALETACLEEYFGCKEDEIPGSKRDFHRKMKHYLRTFAFTKRNVDVPAGANRWSYLIDLWKTDMLSDYSLSDCIRSESLADFETVTKRKLDAMMDLVTKMDERLTGVVAKLDKMGGP